MASFFRGVCRRQGSLFSLRHSLPQLPLIGACNHHVLVPTALHHHYRPTSLLVKSGCQRESIPCRSFLKTPFSTSTNAEVLDKVTEELGELNQQQNKLFAVVHISGRQFKITPNDLIVVNRIDTDIGDEIYLEKVLLAGSEDVTLIGRPLLSEELIRVKATVIEHTKTAKVIVFKKKRRKNYKRKEGHRQPVSVLRINSIHINTESKLN